MTMRTYSGSDMTKFICWVVTTAIGASTAFGCVGLVLTLVSPMANIDGDKLFAVLLAPLLGLSIGSMQWALIRKDISHSARWPAANVVGYCTALILASVTNSLKFIANEGLMGELIFIVILGLAVGLPQFLVLKESFAGAGWWMVGSGLGMLSFGIGGVIPAHSLFELVELGLIIGALYGAVGGIPWCLMSTRPIASPQA